VYVCKKNYAGFTCAADSSNLSDLNHNKTDQNSFTGIAGYDQQEEVTADDKTMSTLRHFCLVDKLA